jgi:hypothetical protein
MVLHVVVLLEKAVIVIITIIVTVCGVRSCIVISWRDRQYLNSRGTINEIIRGFVFCA